MASNYQTIVIKNFLNNFEEYEASAGITPGMLAALGSDGKVSPHGVSGGNVAPVMFAIEDALQGKDIEDAYVTGDKVQVWVPTKGEVVLALLADGQNVVIGDLLMSNGAGYLTKYVAESWESSDAQAANTLYPLLIVGVALEAQDLSALEGSESSTAANSQYIKVRIV